MTGFTVIKDPNAKLDYGWNWGDPDDPWLLTGETIATSTWLRFETDGVTPATDITIFSSSNTTTTTTVWLTGGLAGATYKITNHVVSNQAREDDRTITVKVKER